MITVYIGLGSNLDDPEAHIDTAIDDLSGIPQTKLVDKSSLYKSHPLGSQDQPDFINSVAKLETVLPANILLEQLQKIEHKHGRQREIKWGPRTLDLDMLLYGDMKISESNLVIPHPHIASRHFVLCPLMEIDPDVEIPEQGNASDLFAKLGVDATERI